MASHVPIGHVLSRACLAGAGAALLFAAAPGTPCRIVLQSAVSAAAEHRASSSHQPIHVIAQLGDEQYAFAAARLQELLPGVHPVGLSSEGEPDDRSRHSAALVQPIHANQ